MCTTRSGDKTPCYHWCGLYREAGRAVKNLCGKCGFFATYQYSMVYYDANVYMRIKGPFMETAILSLRVPQEVKEQLNKLAKATHRSQSFLGSDAIRRYIELESWQIAEIQQAVTEADSGDFATDDEFNAVVKKHAG